MYIEICIINSYHLFEKSSIGYLEIWVLPWEQRHLPRDKTTSEFQFWASLRQTAATVAPSSPRQSRHCLHYSGQRERDLSSLNPYIFAIAAALPSARERISICVWPLTIPGMPLALSYHLWTCTKSHTNSVTVLVSMTEPLWRDCLHQFVLDAPFIQAKIKSRVTDTWYCIMVTTTTNLSMETEVQEKTQTYTKIYLQFFICFSKKNQFSAPMFR